MTNFSLSKKFLSILPLATAAILSMPANAAVTGTLNVANCPGGSVTVTATTIDFSSTLSATPGVAGCVAAGGSNLQSSTGNIDGANNVGLTGFIFDLSGALPQTFMTFDPAGGNASLLTFILTAVGPGSANTNCAAPPCSVVTGSPITLDGTLSTTAILPVFGTATDGSGVTSTFLGQFSANFPGLSPLQVQNNFKAAGFVTTTYSGSVVLTAVPEPEAIASLAFGLALMGLGVIRRRQGASKV